MSTVPSFKGDGDTNKLYNSFSKSVLMSCGKRLSYKIIKKKDKCRQTQLHLGVLPATFIKIIGSDRTDDARTLLVHYMKCMKKLTHSSDLYFVKCKSSNDIIKLV